ncbi:unnamed protein product [Medioppia subpectinata]|uniref:RING-type domain-containing protein n=1 Tax=Medioppia subpectinata TaxID=1979941 RepID=A0A7R9L5U4_9ACAR|nr:unnamed protein product [Medioppia subpectinata]CAG2115802.1 unnamed protein product [Medioppia subpectinata]
MSSYFDEHECPQRSAEDEVQNLYLSLARMLQDMGFESDVMSALNREADRRPPASEQFIKNLPKVTQLTAGEKCCVCLKPHSVGETVSVDCGHKFHVQCITRWLRLNNSCPVCRTEFPTDDEEYETNKRLKRQKEATLQELHNSMFS